MPGKLVPFLARAGLYLVPLAILANIWLDLGIGNFGWKLLWSILTIAVTLAIFSGLEARLRGLARFGEAPWQRNDEPDRSRPSRAGPFAPGGREPKDRQRFPPAQPRGIFAHDPRDSSRKGCRP